MADCDDTIEEQRLEEEGSIEETQPDIEWNESLTDLDRFENGSGLPQVVKYGEKVEGAAGARHSGAPGSLPTGLRIYSEQPVLFHTRTCKRHVSARTIYHDKEGPYYEVGQTLTIPEDFEGWFELVPPDFGRALVCQSISQVAEIMPRKFFLRTKVRAIREVKSEEAEESEAGQKFLERRIPRGTVLGVEGTFAAKWRTSATTGFIKKKSKEWMTVEVMYLKCRDTDGEEVLIPFSTKGRFSIIYEKGNTDSRAVFRLKDLISDFKFPVKVRMVFGKAPVVPCIFTGMLILKDCSKEDTIIGSTILNKRNVLFEIPVKTKCSVQTATDANSYANLPTYINAKGLCEKYALSYSSMIKLSPKMDTDQQMIQHIPTEKRKKRDESLKTLDLINSISITDDEPGDYYMKESSDSDSLQSEEASPLASGQMMELTEIKLPRQSNSFTSC